jgi:hypothetical protein
LLCIEPVGGGWRGCSDARFCNKQACYALVVSLKADNQEVTFHTDIIDGSVSVGQNIDIGF